MFRVCHKVLFHWRLNCILYFFDHTCISRCRPEMLNLWAKSGPWNHCIWPVELPRGWEIWQWEKLYPQSPAAKSPCPLHLQQPDPGQAHIPFSPFLWVGARPYSLSPHPAEWSQAMPPFPHIPGLGLGHVSLSLKGWFRARPQPHRLWGRIRGGPRPLLPVGLDQARLPPGPLHMARWSPAMPALGPGSGPLATSGPWIDWALPIQPTKEKSWAPLV